MQQELNHAPLFDLAALRRERIATQCVCCGSDNLKASTAVLMPFVAHRIFGWKPVMIDENWGLKTITNGIAYSICNSLYCSDCGLLFLDIRFSESELNNLYKEYRGYEYTKLRETYEPEYTIRNDSLNSGIEYIEEIEEFLRPHLSFPISILDWGGDTGKNTPFKNEGFDIYDISNKPVIGGGRIVSKELAFSKKYKLIVCSNVLEHVPFPSDVLFDIRNTMNSDSVLYIEVPFEDIARTENVDLHLKKKHWHEHINFYSEVSLERLLKNCGLKAVAFKEYCTNAGGKLVWLFQIACKLK